MPFQTPRMEIDSPFGETEEGSGVRDWDALGLRPRRCTPMPIDAPWKPSRAPQPLPSSPAPQRAAARSPAVRSQEQTTDPRSRPRPEAAEDAQRGTLKPQSISVDLRTQAMVDCLCLGDDESALRLAESILVDYPKHARALQCVQYCRRSLERSYARRIGSLEHKPIPLVQGEPVVWLQLDPREAFVLSLLDGVTTAEEVLDITGMPRLDALRTLSRLVERDVVWMEA